MNKTVLMTATIASLAVNVMAANNNTLAGTDNNIPIAQWYLGTKTASTLIMR